MESFHGHGLRGVGTEDSLGKRVASLCRASEDHLSQYWDDWFYAIRTYKRQEEKNPYDETLSDFFPPILYEAISTAKARLLAAVLSTDPEYRMISRRPDLAGRMEAIEVMIAEHRKLARHDSALDFSIENGLLTTLGPIRYGWETEWDGGRLVRHEMACQSVLPIYLRLDPMATSFRRTWVGEVRVMRKSALEDLAAGGAPLKNLDAVGDSEDTDDATIRLFNAAGKNAPTHARDDDDGKDPLIKIIRFYNDDWECIVEAQSEKVLWAQRNPIRMTPFCMLHYNPMDGMLVGDSMADLMSHIQEQVKMIERLALNSLAFQIMPQFLIDRDANINRNDLTPRPWGLVDYTPNDRGQPPIQPLFKPGTPPEVQSALARMMRYGEGATHFNEDMRGVSPNRKENVGAVYARLEEGNRSLMPAIKGINRDVIERSVEIYFRLVKANQVGSMPVTLSNRAGLPFSEMARQMKITGVDPGSGAIHADAGPELFDGIEDGMVQISATGTYGLSVKEAVREGTADLIKMSKELGILEQAPDVAEELVLTFLNACEVPGRSQLASKFKAHFDRVRQQMAAAVPAPAAPAAGGASPNPMMPPSLMGVAA